MQEDQNTAEYRLDDLSKAAFDRSWKGKLERFLDSQYFFWAVLVLVAVTSFCFGRVSKIQSGREPVRVVSENVQKAEASGEVKGAATQIENTNLPNPLYIKEGTEQQNGIQVVGSKNGTKYHLPSCPGAKQISEKNKITFNSIEEAKAKGYTAASNCKGLK